MRKSHTQFFSRFILSYFLDSIYIKMVLLVQEDVTFLTQDGSAETQMKTSLLSFEYLRNKRDFD